MNRASASETAASGTAGTGVIATAVDDRSARGIASAVGRLINRGELVAGTRLPTVRVLAEDLGVSPTTVSEAWRVLSGAGAIDPRGRQGTFVVGPLRASPPRRFRLVTEAPGSYALDLSTGTPDPLLLPDLAAPIARLGRRSLTSSYLDDPVLPALADALRAEWPFVPEALAVVDGAMDAIDRLATLLVRLGDRVVVENPTFPPLLDLLEHLGVEVLDVAVDDAGILPAALAETMTAQPRLLVTQPRAHNPLGISTTAARAAELAAVLDGRDILVIEDDHAGHIAASPLASIGVHLPAQTILIRSYSKSHGPDLRLAAVGGAGTPIRRMMQRRILGPGWSSRLLQAVLAELLLDPLTATTIAAARSEYARRRQVLATAITARGLAVSGHDGINLWVQVPDERTAQLGLAVRGIGVAPGTPFLVSPLPHDHLRLTSGLVAAGADELAAHLLAATGQTGATRPTSRPTR